MTGSFFLTHDIGTGALKSALVDDELTVVASMSTPVETVRGPGGKAEQDPESWWGAACAHTRRLVERLDSPSRIAAVAAGGHMLGLVCVDAAGMQVRPALIHADTRARNQAELLRERVGAEELYRRTGNVLDSRASIAKVLYLKQEEPESYGRTARFMQSKDFLVGRLVGSFDTTDYSDGAHGLLMDVHTRHYLTDVFSELGIDAGRFPAIRAGVDRAGVVCAEAARACGLAQGTPVVVGAGDGACAGVGAGCLLPGEAYCSFGTTAWIGHAVSGAVLDPKRQIFLVPGVTDDLVYRIGTIQNAGSAVRWALETFGADFEDLEAALSVIPAGSGGLLFLPYLTGERTPVWDADARGAYLGIDESHTRDHFLRAALEGVVFGLSAVLRLMQADGAVERLGFVGGGFRSGSWIGLVSDLFGVDLTTPPTAPEDAGCVGAAVAAAVGVGHLASVADAAAVRRHTHVASPRVEAHAAYESLFPLYEAGYERLKPIFHGLRSFAGRG